MLLDYVQCRVEHCVLRKVLVTGIFRWGLRLRALISRTGAVQAGLLIELIDHLVEGITEEHLVLAAVERLFALKNGVFEALLDAFEVVASSDSKGFALGMAADWSDEHPLLAVAVNAPEFAGGKGI